MLGEVCPYDHGHDPVEVDDTNLPQMLSLAGIPGTQTNPHMQAPLQIFPNVAPPRPIVPQIAGGLTLNTGLTTVQVQKPRPIPSPIELPRNQVPIFRPRNPMAFMRHISPPSKYFLSLFMLFGITELLAGIVFCNAFTETLKLYLS